MEKREVAFFSKRKSRMQTNPKAVIVETIILFIITVVLVSMSDAFRDFRRMKKSQYQKLCFSNQRVITGAIDKYNEEQKTKITDFNNSVYDLLIKEKYLINGFLDDIECNFNNEGDLSQDGFIYCQNHGAANGKKDGLDIYAHPMSRKASRLQLKNDLIITGVLFVPALLFFIINLI